ncbi:hypothetical protein D3C77_257730 [compost metagenome]
MIVGLTAGVRDHAAPIEKHQGVADTEVAQIDRTDVPAREIAAGGAIGRVERHISHLRDGTIKIVTADRSYRIEGFAIDPRHRQGRRDLSAPDLGPHDHDLFNLCDSSILRPCPARTGQRSAGQQ